MSKPKWVQVRGSSPCPVCGRTSWCTRTTAGDAAKCMFTESDKPVESGGWVHKLKGDEITPPPPPKAHAEKMSPKEVADIVGSMFRHCEAEKARKKDAGKLKVSPRSMRDLCVGVGWDDYGINKKFTSWPCRNAEGDFIGYSRRYRNGEKKTAARTRSGLFYADSWSIWPGPIFVVEGGSDVAAMETAGLCAVGRPSNQGGSKEIAKLVRKKSKEKAVVIIAENDFSPERNGTKPCKEGCKVCLHCYPGVAGAIKVAFELATALKKKVFWCLPEGGKDARECLRRQDCIDYLGSARFAITDGVGGGVTKEDWQGSMEGTIKHVFTRAN